MTYRRGLLWILLKFNGHEEYLGSSICPDGRTPCAYSSGYKNMWLAFFLVPCRELKKTLQDEIEWPELAIVRMPRELYINTIFFCFGEFFWVMIEEDNGFFLVDKSEEIRKSTPMSSKTCWWEVILASDDYSSDFHHFVLEKGDTMLSQIGARPLHTPYILMIPSNRVGAIGWSELAKVSSEVSANHRIDLTIHDIAGQENQIGIQCVDFFHDMADMTDAIGWPEMYITRNSERESFMERIFFLYFDSVASDSRISRIDVSEGYRGNCSYHCYPGDMIAEIVNLCSCKPSCEDIHREEYVIDDTCQEKMHYPDKPKRSESDQCIRDNGASSLLYDFTDYIGKGKAQENTCKKPFRYTEIFCHIPSVEKYIAIYESVEEQENTKKEEKVWMTHEWWIRLWNLLYSLLKKIPRSI